MSSYHTIADFIADVKAVLAAGDVSDDLLERLAAVMRDLVRSPIVVQVHDELTGTIHHGRQSGPLYTDESGLTLVRGRCEPTAFTPIHNHMRALLIIVVAEVRRLHAGLTHRGEDVHVQAFIPHGAIEALLFAILPWAAWVNI